MQTSYRLTNIADILNIADLLMKIATFNFFKFPAALEAVCDLLCVD